MACRQVQLLATVAAVACLASLASATVWLVGDKVDGWTANFNETGWEKNKTFVVGDNLLFMYTPVNHTVVQVGEEDFAACNGQANAIGNWSSGADVVPLVTPGKAWFICTTPNHCLNGMKMAIDVKEADATPASAAPVSYTVGGAVAVAGAVVAAVLAL